MIGIVGGARPTSTGGGDCDHKKQAGRSPRLFFYGIAVAVRANGDADPPVCGRCATSE